MVVTTSFSVVQDDGEIVHASHCKVYGNDCTVTGSFCKVYGKRCKVSGSHCKIYGEGGSSTGSFCKIYARRCKFSGSFIKRVEGGSLEHRAGSGSSSSLGGESSSSPPLQIQDIFTSSSGGGGSGGSTFRGGGKTFRFSHQNCFGTIVNIGNSCVLVDGLNLQELAQYVPEDRRTEHGEYAFETVAEAAAQLEIYRRGGSHPRVPNSNQHQRTSSSIAEQIRNDRIFAQTLENDGDVIKLDGSAGDAKERPLVVHSNRNDDGNAEVEPPQPALFSPSAEDISSDAVTEDETKQCVICLDHLKVVALIPCGHKCLCFTCCKGFSEKEHNSPCPVCRSAVSAFCKIFE